MDGRDARSLQLAFQAEIEIGRINPDKQVRRIFLEMRRQLAPHLEQPKQMAQHLKVPADRKTLHGKQRDGPFGPHLGAGDTDELNIWTLLFKRPDQMAAEQVARSLSGYDSNNWHSVTMNPGETAYFRRRHPCC